MCDFIWKSRNHVKGLRYAKESYKLFKLTGKERTLERDFIDNNLWVFCFVWRMVKEKRRERKFNLMV